MIALAGLVAVALFILPVFQIIGASADAVGAVHIVNNWRVRGCPERWFEDNQIHYRCLPAGQTKPVTAKALK